MCINTNTHMNTPDIQFEMEWVYHQIKNEHNISNCNPESIITMSHFSKTQYQRSDRLSWEFHDGYGYQSPCVWHLLFELPVTRGPFQYKDPPIASYKDFHYKDKMLRGPAYIYINVNFYTFTLLGILMLVLKNNAFTQTGFETESDNLVLWYLYQNSHQGPLSQT